jgi:hypothetical protein
MEYDERADELEKDADKLEHEAEETERRAEQTASEWESAKSASDVPGAVDEEAAGPHNIDEEDPATGRRYGEERQAELDDAREQDE